MRLLTHNSLRCPAKDVIKGYPLLLKVEESEVTETEFNEEFIAGLLPSLDWSGILVAAAAMGVADGMPQQFDNALLTDGDFLAAMHHLLLCIQVKKGKMICPESGREFVIVDGIPDMM